MHVEIANNLVHGRQQEEIEHVVQEGLLIHDYLNAEISIGEFSEKMGMSITDGRDWLHRHGVATMRSFVDPELKKVSTANYEKVSEELGIAVAQSNK